MRILAIAMKTGYFQRAAGHGGVLLVGREQVQGERRCKKKRKTMFIHVLLSCIQGREYDTFVVTYMRFRCIFSIGRLVFSCKGGRAHF